MHKYIFGLIFLLGLWFLPQSGLAQNGLGLHYLPQTFQSTYTNPAFIQQAKFQLTLPILIPPTEVGVFHSGFTLQDMVVDINENPLRFDPDKLLGALGENNILRTRFNMAPLGFAFKLKGLQFGVHTGVKVDGYFGYPRDLPALAWTGNGPFIGQTIQIAPEFQFLAYRETGLQVAIPLGKKLVVGARLKYLNGLFNISADPLARDISLYTDPEYYQLTLNTDYRILAGTSVDVDLEELIDLEGLAGDSTSGGGEEFNPDFASLTSLTRNPGVGIDLGIVFRPIEKLELNASVINLGSITWGYNSQVLASQGEITFNGVDPFENVEESLNGSELGEVVENSLNGYLDSALTTFLPDGQQTSFKTALPVRFFLSGRYEIVGPLIVGVTYSGEAYRARYNSMFSFYGGLNVRRWLTLGTTLTVDQRYGNMWGVHSRLNLGPFQLYGSVGNLLSLIRPENARAASIAIGTNWTFGRKDKKREKKNQQDN